MKNINNLGLAFEAVEKQQAEEAILLHNDWFFIEKALKAKAEEKPAKGYHPSGVGQWSRKASWGRKR